MIPADVEALALADAAGALDPDEQRELRAALDRLPPEVQAEVARLYDTFTLELAGLAPVETPDPAVRARVLEAAREPARYAVTDHSAGWLETPLPGIQVKVLALDRVRRSATLLIRGLPGAVYPAHRHSGPEECYVLRGSIQQDGATYYAGDFIHADEGSDHGEISTVEGAEVLLVGAIDDYLPDIARTL